MAHDLSSLEKDPRLFLYTSLTAGSSHVISATSRMETILKANKIPFVAIDTATDEKARRLWQRRAGKRKLPGLVKEGFVVGDLAEIEEWNEFGELKENIGPVPASTAPPSSGGQAGVNTAPPLSHNVANVPSGSKPAPINKAPQPLFDKSKAIALPGAEEIAARNKAASLRTSGEAVKDEAPTSVPKENSSSVEAVKEISKSNPALEHLSAPASRIHSGTVTPAQAEEPAQEEAVTEKKHRGSEVIAASPEEIKQVESNIALKEEVEEEDEDAEASTAKGIADAKLDEGDKVVPDARNTKALGDEESKSLEDDQTTLEKAQEEPGHDKNTTEEVGGGPEDAKKEPVGDEKVIEHNDKKTQEQDAKEPDDAGKSVED